MRQRSHRAVLQHWAMVVAASCLGAAGCTSLPERAGQSTAAPRPSTSASLMTLRTLEIGASYTATAAVATILAAAAFTIDDVDLPDRGLLVLGEAPGDLRHRSLVTVEGTIDRFAFDRFARTYGLTSPEAYEKFADHKIVVADHIRRWD